MYVFGGKGFLGTFFSVRSETECSQLASGMPLSPQGQQSCQPGQRAPAPGQPGWPESPLRTRGGGHGGCRVPAPALALHPTLRFIAGLKGKGEMLGII